MTTDAAGPPLKWAKDDNVQVSVGQEGLNVVLSRGWGDRAEAGFVSASDSETERIPVPPWLAGDANFAAAREIDREQERKRKEAAAKLMPPPKTVPPPKLVQPPPSTELPSNGEVEFQKAHRRVSSKDIAEGGEFQKGHGRRTSKDHRRRPSANDPLERDLSRIVTPPKATFEGELNGEVVAPVEDKDEKDEFKKGHGRRLSEGRTHRRGASGGGSSDRGHRRQISQENNRWKDELDNQFANDPMRDPNGSRKTHKRGSSREEPNQARLRTLEPRRRPSEDLSTSGGLRRVPSDQKISAAAPAAERAPEAKPAPSKTDARRPVNPWVAKLKDVHSEGERGTSASESEYYESEEDFRPKIAVVKTFSRPNPVNQPASFLPLFAFLLAVLVAYTLLFLVDIRWLRSLLSQLPQM